MTEDRELDAWREQWSSIANTSPDSERKIHRRIKQQSQRFVIGNVLTAIAFAGILLFAVVARHQLMSIGTGWVPGICVLVVVSVAGRIWILRETWRPETQTTRA